MEDDRTWKEKLMDKIYQLLFGWECSPGWYRFARYVELFIMDPFVDLFITLCIVGNTAFMACDHADITPQFASVLNIGNNVRRCHLPPVGVNFFRNLVGASPSPPPPFPLFPFRFFPFPFPPLPFLFLVPPSLKSVKEYRGIVSSGSNAFSCILTREIAAEC